MVIYNLNNHKTEIYKKKKNNCLTKGIAKLQICNLAMGNSLKNVQHRMV